MLAYGVKGLLGAPRATHPPQAARWLLGGLLAHDLLIFPVTALVGLLLTRLIKAPYRAVVQGALLVSGAVMLASLPLWRGYGGPADNATVDPLPYGRNLLIVLGAVWAGAAIIIAVRATHLRRQRSAPPDAPKTDGATGPESQGAPVRRPNA
jgi:hypothetical protein